MAEGHPWAKKYPLATLWYEAQLARERINAQIATETTMLDAVITAHLSPKGRSGREHLRRLLRSLNGGW